jgi:ribosome-binding factor A
MAGNRRERIARVIREEASRVVLYELADPRIGFVTVTKVKVSPDLSHARVYVSVYGDERAREETMKALSGAARVVQRACGPRLKTRIIPHVEFEFDPSVEGAIHMSQLIREARATDPDGGTGESPAGAGPSAGEAGEDARPEGEEAEAVAEPRRAEEATETEEPGE